MEKRIKNRFNEQILQEAMSRFAIPEGSIRILDGFESFIYEYTKNGEQFILRIAHSLRRSEALIHAEVEWINYLAENGTGVAKAVLSANNQLVESIPDSEGDFFLVAAFVKAQGVHAWEYGWNKNLYVTYGKLIGRMHALTKDFQPSHPEWKRPQWNDEIMLDIHRNLPESEAPVKSKFDELVKHISLLEKNRENFGLVHFDAHAGNFFVNENGNITLFDFDDCCYHWFSNDVAIVLFYMIRGTDDQSEFVDDFMAHFLKGYQQENIFATDWLKQIPMFLKLREIDLYSVIHRSFDVNNLQDRWAAFFMKNRKERILNDVPFLDFDFTSLEKYLIH